MKINFVTNIFDSIGEGTDGRSSLDPGHAQWAEGGTEGHPGSLLFICPCGCHRLRSVPIAPADRGWTWNGDLEKPTLTPSILILGECGWHGFLTNGEWRTC